MPVSALKITLLIRQLFNPSIISMNASNKSDTMKNISENIICQLIESNAQTRAQLAEIKRKIAGSFKLPQPSTADLLRAYRQLLAGGEIQTAPRLESLLKKRAVRTLSGVAVVAVLTKPYPCRGKCAYCPTEKAMPKSYLSNEPAVMRAVLCGFHPYRQVRHRLEILENNGHPTDKVELIIMGGTWSHLPRQYQTWFIKECFRATNATGLKTLNSKLKIKSLKELQKINETSKRRIVGLTLETRPDCVTPAEIKRMRELGCTRVELGVQTTDDFILQLNRRGHNVQAVVEATKLLKDAGLKITYHMMPNLPGAAPAKDLGVFKELFANPDFRPDMLKIYPCVVTEHSLLYRWWKKGKYKPYDGGQLLDLLVKIKEIIPPYVRIARLIRDIPSSSIAAGNKVSNLREAIAEEMRRRGRQCQCIRCREIKGAEYEPKNIKYIRREYAASGGREYFLSFEDIGQNKLLAFLRLRLPPLTHGLKSIAQNLPELKEASLIREVHTYGQAVQVNEHSKTAAQHFGFGKKLMAAAEKIAREAGFAKMAVISGVGAREYYRKIGYIMEGTYMVKYL